MADPADASRSAPSVTAPVVVGAGATVAVHVPLSICFTVARHDTTPASA